MKKVSLPPMIQEVITSDVGKPWESVTKDIREECGYDIVSFQEIVSTSDDISDAVPVILRHLWQETDPHVVIMLVRSILDKRYIHLIDTNKVIEKYFGFNDTWIGNNPNGARGMMAYLIAALIHRNELHRVYKDFLEDESLGDTRVWFLYRLNKQKPTKEFYDFLVKTVHSHPVQSTYPYPTEVPNAQDGFEMKMTAENILKSKKFDQFRNH